MSIFNSTDKIYHLLLMKEIHTLGGLSDEQYADLIKTLWGIDIPQHNKGAEAEDTVTLNSPISIQADDGDEILVSNRRFVWMDVFCSDVDGCYLDSGDDIDEDMAWMPLPKPYRDESEVEE